MPGIRPSDHGDPHRHTLPHVTLAGVTELDSVSADIDNAHAVEVLLTSLQDQDADGAGAVLDDNLVYQNVGFPTIRGRARAMKLFRAMEGRAGFEVKIHRIAVNGPTVLTERTDVLQLGPVRLQFWVCGVFEVHNGRITLWRDYFDMFDMTKALMRGVVGAMIPALRPTL
ncbi:MAG: nuclear transport factor 2 family protein [Mycobacterium sp.]|nr:nuclear transport factor 2 family protein [Mycobacterium sp.]